MVDRSNWRDQLFVHAISLVNVPANALEAMPHSHVVLENPGTFTLGKSCLVALDIQVDDEHRIDALLPMRGFDTQREHTRRIDFPFVPKKLGPANRKQSTVHVLERTVEVRQLQRKANRLAVDLCNRTQMRVDDGPH